MSLDTTTQFGDADVLADTTNMTRSDWLALRHTGIGGSDAAAICGQNRWTSPFEVWLDKTGRYTPEPAGEAADWGTLLEPIVRDQTAIRTGHQINPCRLLLANQQRTWQLANIDGDIPDIDAIYEGKTASVYLADDWADDQVPDAYLLQGQHYLSVTGRQRVLYGVLIGGQRLEVRTVERDAELIDHLIQLEAEFWDLVLNDTPPPPDGSKACTDLLAHMWDVRPDTIRTLEPDEVAHVEQLLAARADAKAAEAAAAEAAATAENELKVLVADHEVLATPAGTPLFTWKQQTRSTVDAKALRAVHPDIADQFTNTSTFRKVHIPKRKAA
jgi:putative phage-type endonuclease